MSGSSNESIGRQYKRLGERAAFHEGSVWDGKIYGLIGLAYVNLRFKGAE